MRQRNEIMRNTDTVFRDVTSCSMRKGYSLMSELMRDCATRRRGKNTHGESCKKKKVKGGGRKKILECKVRYGKGKEMRESILRKDVWEGGKLSDFS
jgi:hypothetical protein